MKKNRALHMRRFFKPEQHMILLPLLHWPELGHMGTQSAREGAWEMSSSSVSRRIKGVGLVNHFSVSTTMMMTFFFFFKSCYLQLPLIEHELGIIRTLHQLSHNFHNSPTYPLTNLYYALVMCQVSS